MTRKDYAAMVSIIAELAPSAEHDTFIDALCALFARDNSAFDKALFTSACMIYHRGDTACM
jgi:hypothetical protein